MYQVSLWNASGLLVDYSYFKTVGEAQAHADALAKEWQNRGHDIDIDWIRIPRKPTWQELCEA
jgi:hypothetical protein